MTRLCTVMQRRAEIYPMLAPVKITVRVLNVQPLTPLRLLKSNCISTSVDLVVDGLW